MNILFTIWVILFGVQIINMVTGPWTVTIDISVKKENEND